MHPCIHIYGQDRGIDTCSCVFALPRSTWARTGLGDAVAGGWRNCPPRLLAEGTACEVMSLQKVHQRRPANTVGRADLIPACSLTVLSPVPLSEKHTTLLTWPAWDGRSSCWLIPALLSSRGAIRWFERELCGCDGLLSRGLVDQRLTCWLATNFILRSRWGRWQRLWG